MDISEVVAKTSLKLRNRRCAPRKASAAVALPEESIIGLV